jgi:hypothetical protein
MICSTNELLGSDYYLKVHLSNDSRKSGKGRSGVVERALSVL